MSSERQWANDEARTMTDTTTRDAAEVAAEKIEVALALGTDDCVDGRDVTRADLAAIIRAAYAGREEPWEKALKYEAAMRHINPEQEPRKLISEIVGWELMVANDPAVSEDARKRAERDAAVANLIKRRDYWNSKLLYAAPEQAVDIARAMSIDIHGALSRLTAPAPQPCEYGFDTVDYQALVSVIESTDFEDASRRLAAIRELERRVRKEGGDDE